MQKLDEDEYWYIFYHSFRIFEQLTLSLNNRVALKFFTVLKYFLSFRIFEQIALALEFFKAGWRQPSPPRTPMLKRTTH